MTVIDYVRMDTSGLFSWLKKKLSWKKKHPIPRSDSDLSVNSVEDVFSELSSLPGEGRVDFPSSSGPPVPPRSNSAVVVDLGTRRRELSGLLVRGPARRRKVLYNNNDQVKVAVPLQGEGETLEMDWSGTIRNPVYSSGEDGEPQFECDIIINRTGKRVHYKNALSVAVKELEVLRPEPEFVKKVETNARKSSLLQKWGVKKNSAAKEELPAYEYGGALGGAPAPP